MVALEHRVVSPVIRRHSRGCPSAAPRPSRVEFIGRPLDALTMDQTVGQVLAMVDCGMPHQHVCLNAAKVVLAEDDAKLRDIVDSCDLVNADGQAVVWAAKLLGQPVPERVAGVDLFERLLGEAEERGLRVYLLGATTEVLFQTLIEVQRRHPQLQIAGARDGYWDADEEAGVVSTIAGSHADLLFVAMPSPKKERFLARHGSALGVPFLMGVGGSFDVLAGQTKRAPRWMRRCGMEWFYRLLQEPFRMVRRYAVGNTRFILLTLSARRHTRRTRAAATAAAEPALESAA
ncbi:MAG: N-acetylglucosaminyldiphosphoundecaprenol N-acetyl-beta-D-mannosaminyltransferase [Frankiales bacterium]|nr:N-acetylglucosaminyldiphosphoundecaprenol N-acetyl-beta-D-mannosaminyltransferase [Frankiales bacterium]